jgi:1,4-dihydroxy-6-naphthoate synthase
VDWRGLRFDIELLDIELLNERLLGDGFDVGKTSFHAALHLADEYMVLPSGSALGRCCYLSRPAPDRKIPAN